LHRGDPRFDVGSWPRSKAELRLSDDLAAAKPGTAVRERQVRVPPPRRAADVDDESAGENARDVAAVRTGVHANTTADRPGDRARELEPAEAGATRPVEADRKGGAASRADDVALDPGGGELAVEPHDERVNALVGDEQIRAQADDLDREAAMFSSISTAANG
jgi:hypothetical protein